MLDSFRYITTSYLPTNNPSQKPADSVTLHRHAPRRVLTAFDLRKRDPTS